MRVVDKEIAASFKFLDPVEVTNRYAAYLKDEMDCDIVLCLSHMGYMEDREVAASLRNVDLIVGGHSHTLLHKKQLVKDADGKDVVIVQNWKTRFSPLS